MRNFPNVYCSFSPGMPVVNGIPGSFLEAFKKIMVNGTDKVSYTEIKVIDGLAYITALVDWQVFHEGVTINVEGCDEPLLNGFQTVKTFTKFNYCFETTAADGTYGGSIKVNQPPAGWVILYSGTNEAVFVSGNLDTLGVCIKIKETTSLYADVEIYESMTSLTDGVNKANPLMLGANRVFRIVKTNQANTVQMHYWFAADNTSCHFCIDRKIEYNPDWNVFYGDYVISFGQCTSFNKNFKKNFYFIQPSCTSSESAGYYNIQNSLVGHNYDVNFFSNIVYYSGCYLSNNGFQNWKLSTVQAGNFSFNRTVLSGSVNNISLIQETPANFLVSPTILFSAEINFSGSALAEGYLEEVMFFNSFLFNFKEKFKIELVNNKKYILLPIKWRNDPIYNNTTIGSNGLGMVGILLGSKWGE